MDTDTKKREAGCTCQQEEGDSECVIHDPPTCKRCGCEYTMKWPDTEPTKYCNACAHAVVEAAETRAEKAEGERDKLDEERVTVDALVENHSAAVQSLVDENNVLTSELAEARAERDALVTERESLDRLRTIVDEEFGMQPPMSGEDALTLLERGLFERRAAAADVERELAEARRQLGEAVEVQEDLAGKLFDAVQERDALKAGRWASAWESLDGTADGAWARYDTSNVLMALAYVPGKWTGGRGRANEAADLDAAKAAADAHLIAAGWWLEGGPHGAGEAK